METLGRTVGLLLVSRIWTSGSFLKAWDDSLGKRWIRMNLFAERPAEVLRRASA